MYKFKSVLKVGRTNVTAFKHVHTFNGWTYTTDGSTAAGYQTGLSDGVRTESGLEVPGIDVFPVCLDVPKKVTDTVSIDVADLEWVARAVSTDPSRAVLYGVLLDRDGAVVATDGHRLHWVDTPYHHDSDSDIIITTDFIKAVVSAAKKTKHSRISIHCATVPKGVKDPFGVEREIDRMWSWAHIGEYHIVGRTIDGPYPSWRKAVPTEFTGELSISLDGIKEQAGLALAVAGSKKNFKHTLCLTSDNKLSFIANDRFVSKFGSWDGDTPVKDDSAAKNVAFAVNDEFLLTIADKRESIRFEINGYDTAAVTDMRDGSDYGRQALIMPLRICHEIAEPEA